jgi:hypothetical protein
MIRFLLDTDHVSLQERGRTGRFDVFALPLR